jgi:hypothetical protein
VAPLEDIQWQRTVGGLEVVGLTARADAAELEILEGAVTEIPAEVWQTAGVRSIVRTSGTDGTDLHPATTAFARGPDIYLLDRTFAEPRTGRSRLALARVLSHEIAHVAQFASLDDSYVSAVLDGRITDTDTSHGSTLVRDYAEATGWVDRGSDRFAPAWELPAAACCTTAYGRTSPDEDMAEALALSVLGRAGDLDRVRASWVEGWLGVPTAVLGADMPWIPPGSVELFLQQDLYDADGVATLATGHADAQYYELIGDQPDTEVLARTISAELRSRGMPGALVGTADDRLPRFQGSFRRSDGTVLWAELWDFRGVSGFAGAPDGPLLVYVLAW